MKKTIILLLLTFLSYLTADVEVGGWIYEDTVWSPENGEYHVISTLRIHENATLTIKPGTVVKLKSAPFLEHFPDNFFPDYMDDSPAYIIVYGSLIARGSEENKIIMKPDNDDPDYHWGTVLTSENSEYLIFQHCHIKNLGKTVTSLGPRESIYCESRYFIITDCLIQNPAEEFAYYRNEANGGTFELTNNMFIKNRDQFNERGDFHFDFNAYSNDSVDPFLVANNQLISSYPNSTKNIGASSDGPLYYCHNSNSRGYAGINPLNLTGFNSFIYKNTHDFLSTSYHDENMLYCSENVVDTFYCDQSDNTQSCYYKGNNFKHVDRAVPYISNNNYFGRVGDYREETPDSNFPSDIIHNYHPSIIESREYQDLTIRSDIYNFLTHYPYIFEMGGTIKNIVHDNKIAPYYNQIHFNKVDTILNSVILNLISTQTSSSIFIDYSVVPAFFDNSNITYGEHCISLDTLGIPLSDIFVDPVNGDYRPCEGSILIDAGIGTTEEPPYTALGGTLRAWDGDGDGIPQIDIGAYEYGAPEISKITGYIYDTDTGEPVQYALVLADSMAYFHSFTDENGYFEMQMYPGTYDLYASRLFYENTVLYNVQHSAEENTFCEFNMTTYTDYFTSIGEDIQTPTSNLVLEQNYPNPLKSDASRNSETIISFQIPNNSNVDLSIFNLKGQKVKTLLNEDLKKGKHQIKWNGTNNNNKNCSSGVYFYRLKNGTSYCC
jgi:hypothetical protein